MTDDRRGNDPDAQDELLRALSPDVNPPAGLRDAVIQRLTASGLLGSSVPVAPATSAGRWRRWALVAATASIAFFAGRASVTTALPSGLVTSPETPDPLDNTVLEDVENRWAFLLYEDERFDPGSLSMPEIDARYWQWIDEASAAGVVDAAERLGATEFILSGGPPQERPAGSGEPPGALTGVLLVHAPTLEAAFALARETPHWQFGGNVLIRFIEPR